MIMGVVILVYLIFFVGAPAMGCMGSGGKVKITSECKASGIFSNNCELGACAPKYRANKLTCQCYSGCFNGTKCVKSKF